MRLRKRALVFFLLPVALVLWMVGWILYSRGSRGEVETEKTDFKDDGIQISVGDLKEEAEYNQ